MWLKLISYMVNLHRLKKNQWLSTLELEKLQEKKLKTLLHHAYYNVDYYHKLFDRAGIRPEDIHSIQDIDKIPTTTKRDLQDLSTAEITTKGTDLSHCINLKTSGSTGMPLDIFTNYQEIRQRWLSYRRMYFDNAGRLTDREVITTAPRNFKLNNWFQNHGILEIKYISIFDEVEKQLKFILEFRPHIIDAYPSTLKNLATEITRRKIKCIMPRLLFTSAVFLTEADRKLITSTFQAELFDHYACNEVGIIAFECKTHFGYHICVDNVIVEFIKEDGTKAEAGEEGEIILTGLNSYTMPFIRYRLGDMGILSDKKCPCGNMFPLMKIITGRINDYIALPSGNRVSPYRLMMTMDKIEGIMKYQVIQEKENEIYINIKIMQTSECSNEIISEIEKIYKETLGENLAIEVNVVLDIANEVSGKFKTIISKIKRNL